MDFSSSVTVGQISKNVTLRIETVLNLVLKFQVDRACFHGEEASAKSSGKVE